jgi:hypothetical protein
MHPAPGGEWLLAFWMDVSSGVFVRTVLSEVTALYGFWMTATRLDYQIAVWPANVNVTGGITGRKPVLTMTRGETVANPNTTSLSSSSAENNNPAEDSSSLQIVRTFFGHFIPWKDVSESEFRALLLNPRRWSTAWKCAMN